MLPARALASVATAASFAAAAAIDFLERLLPRSDTGVVLSIAARTVAGRLPGMATAGELDEGGVPTGLLEYVYVDGGDTADTGDPGEKSTAGLVDSEGVDGRLDPVGADTLNMRRGSLATGPSNSSVS